MSQREAREFVGKVCSIRWQIRPGREHVLQTRINDVGYLPIYGPYLATEAGDVLLDRICTISAAEDKQTAGDKSADSCERIAA